MGTLESFAHLQRFKTNASYPTFDRFLESVFTPDMSSLYSSSQYDQLIFGLALASPIPYVEKGDSGHVSTIITKIPPLKKLQEQLKAFDFRVEVDNIELRRPIVLPANKFRDAADQCRVSPPDKVKFTLNDGVFKEDITVDRYDISLSRSEERFQLFYFDYSKLVNGYPLEFSGYIFLQTTRIFPKECQGILTRIRHVAIGQYDVNIMTYPMAEGPRFSFLSSEVFVRSGLDDALKVDRDGFNTLDPQYVRLQAFVHSILHQKIFPASWEEEKGRNKSRKEREEKQTADKFADRVSATTNRQLTKVEIVPYVTKTSSVEPVKLDKAKKTIFIHQSNPQAKALLARKKSRTVAARVIAAFEVANQETTAERRRVVFYKLVEDIFE
jgi:hypothetical protein